SSTASTRCFPTTAGPASGTRKTDDARIAPSVPTTRAAKRTGRVWHLAGPSYYGISKNSALRDARLEGRGKGFAAGLELDPAEAVLQEAADGQALGLPARQPSRHG